LNTYRWVWYQVKLDQKFEKAMAEEGLADDESQWPEY